MVVQTIANFGVYSGVIKKLSSSSSKMQIRTSILQAYFIGMKACIQKYIIAGAKQNFNNIFKTALFRLVFVWKNIHTCNSKEHNFSIQSKNKRSQDYGTYREKILLIQTKVTGNSTARNDDNCGDASSSNYGCEHWGHGSFESHDIMWKISQNIQMDKQ